MGLLIYTLVLVTLVTLLWKLSAAARYWLKFIIFMVVSLIAACVPIPIMLLRPRDPKNALMPAAGLRACCHWFGLKYSVTGHENIPKDTGCVVLMNHQSILDLAILANLWPIMDNCAVISKKEIFYLQPFGLASWLWGTIFIDRANANDARSKVNKSVDAIKRKKSRILMFPEGTRSLGKKMLPFKKGAFHLAVDAQCPIQPVAVSKYKFLGNQRFDDGEVRIKILPAISTKGCTKDDLPRIMDEAYKIMSKNVDAITAEIDAKQT